MVAVMLLRIKGLELSQYHISTNIESECDRLGSIAALVCGESARHYRCVLGLVKNTELEEKPESREVLQTSDS